MSGFVGVPGPGERKCPRCQGHGQLLAVIPGGGFMGGHYQPCDRCDATGVLPALRKGDTEPPEPRKLSIRPAFTGAGAPSFKPARNAKR